MLKDLHETFRVPYLAAGIDHLILDVEMVIAPGNGSLFL